MNHRELGQVPNRPQGARTRDEQTTKSNDKDRTTKDQGQGLKRVQRPRTRAEQNHKEQRQGLNKPQRAQRAQRIGFWQLLLAIALCTLCSLWFVDAVLLFCAPCSLWFVDAVLLSCAPCPLSFVDAVLSVLSLLCVVSSLLSVVCCGSPAAPDLPERDVPQTDSSGMSELIDLTSSRDRYLGAPEFEEMLATAKENADLWASVWRRATVPEEYLRRVARLGGAWHLLVLSEDWCGDAVNTVPVVAKLAELSSNLDLRVLARDENVDLMDAHLTGTSRSIPVVMALDDEFREKGWWGPRPAELQSWALGPGRALEKDERYKSVRAWYARDRGKTTLEEVVGMLERAARP
jgi:hypothetical protein